MTAVVVEDMATLQLHEGKEGKEGKRESEERGREREAQE